MFIKVVKCKHDINPLNVFLSTLRKVGVRERNIKLLLGSVTYTAITETVTCILQLEQLCTAESTTCIIATDTPTCINTIKIVIHIVDVVTATYISAAESYN